MNPRSSVWKVLDFLVVSSRPGCRSRGIRPRVLRALTLSLHRRKGTGVSLLAIYAPVAELVEGDWLAGHGAAHVSARPKDAKIAVEKFNLRFPSVDRSTLESVHLTDPDLTVLCHDARNKGTATLPWIRTRSRADSQALWTRNSLSAKGRATCAARCQRMRAPIFASLEARASEYRIVRAGTRSRQQCGSGPQSPQEENAARGNLPRNEASWTL